MNLHLQGFKKVNENLKKRFYRIMMLAFLLAFFGSSAWAQVTPSKVTPHINTNGGGTMLIVIGGGGGGGGGCTDQPNWTTNFDNETFNVTVNGTAPQFHVTSTNITSYQWYVSTTYLATGFTAIPGATGATYIPDVSTPGTLYYKCEVSNVCGTAGTDEATVVVSGTVTTPVAGTISGGATVCTGTNSTTLKLNGYTGTIQWQSSTNNTNFSDISGANGASYTTSNLTATTWYQAVVTSGGSSATSTSVAVNVNPNASAGTVNAGTSPQCIGSTTTYSVSGAVLGGGTATWSSSNTLVATVDQTGKVTAIGAGTCNIVYTVTGGCGGTVSAQQSYTVTPTASAGTVTPGTTPQCISSTTTYTVLGVVLSGGTGTWSSNNTAVATVDPSTGLVTAVGAGTCNITYTVTGGCNGPVTASQSYVVNPTTMITASPVNGTTPALDNTSFTVEASGAGTLGYQWQVSTGAGNSFTNLTDNSMYSGTSGTTLNLTGVAVNMTGYQYQCVVTGSCGTAISAAATLTVTKRPTVITYTGDNNEQYSDQQTLTATLSDQETGSALTNRPISFTVGTQPVATATDVTGTASATLNMHQDVGAYNVVSSFAGDDTYAASSDTDPFTITKENAITDYTGPEFISVPCTSCATTQVLLSASVIDTSALYPASDPYAGDIRKARVKFIDLDNMQDISGWLTPGLVNAGDTTNGIVTYSWTVALPTTDYDVYTIGVVVDNNGSAGDYIGTSQSVLSVSSSSLTQFITGGGHIIPTNSSGAYASDGGRKVNFGFNVKYNKTGKNLQGNMNIIFRRAGHVYQIKATSMSSLSINTTNPCSQKATFVSKANLIDITDEDNPVSVYGGITLQTTLTDNGEPGKNDLIGITLLNGNTLIYSSNWVSKKTTEILLNGGNLVVNSGVICTNTIATRNEAVMVTEQTPIPSAISVNAYPNPSKDQTSIVYTLPATMHVNLAVYDIMGKKIAQLQDGSESAGIHTVQFNAGNQASGVYIYSFTTLDDKGKLTVTNGKLIIDK